MTSRVHCVAVNWLQTIVEAGWTCLASCLNSQCETLDGAVIIPQTAYTLTYCGWAQATSTASITGNTAGCFSCQPLCMMTLLHCVPLFPSSMSLYPGTINWTEWSGGKKMMPSVPCQQQHCRPILLFYSICISRMCYSDPEGSERVFWQKLITPLNQKTEEELTQYCPLRDNNQHWFSSYSLTSVACVLLWCVMNEKPGL